jgi:hypothetical protein
MRWILYVLGGVVGVVALLLAVMAGVGLALPATHLVARTAHIARSPDDVWRALTDRTSHPTWRKGLERVERLDDGGFREVGRDGTLAFAVDESTPPTATQPGRLVTRIADDSLPFGGRWIYSIAADGTGTRVTITEDGIVRNPLFRFLSRFVFGHTATIDAFLRDLGAHLGSPTTPASAEPSRLPA